MRGGVRRDKRTSPKFAPCQSRSGPPAYNQLVKIRHVILVALFALLQGMAPLLHAHLGADASGLSGVHMHGAPQGAVDADAGTHGSDAGTLQWSGTEPIETPVVGLGQELRRDLSWQPVDVAPSILPGWNISQPQGQHMPPATAVALPSRTVLRLVPPAHAPPAGTC